MTNIISASTDFTSSRLLEEICQLIEATKVRVIQSVNSEMTLLYWHIGKRIKEEVLKFERADYGEQLIISLAKALSEQYGKGFSKTSLFDMAKLYEAYSDYQIFLTLSGKLSWSHFRELLPIKEPLKREFYTELCRIEHWSVRTLREKIGKMLFERTAVAKKPDHVIEDSLKLVREEDRLTADMVLRDPYVLDFLNLPTLYQEKDLEAAILQEIEKFILEFGTSFSFLARQKRISIDNEDYYLDLLFFHRRLRKLIAIELKTEKFKAADKGQMELYLRWLDKYERCEGEGSPIGIILCTAKNQEHVELLEVSNSDIHVAEYLTELPALDIFQKKVQEAINLAKARFQSDNTTNYEHKKE